MNYRTKLSNFSRRTLGIASTVLAFIWVNPTPSMALEILYAQQSNGTIERFDVLTGQNLGVFATGISTIGFIGGMTVDAMGNIFLTKSSTGLSVEVYKITPTSGGMTGTLGLYASFGMDGSSNVFGTGITVDTSGNLFVARRTNGLGSDMFKVTPNVGGMTGTAAPFPGGGREIGGLTMDGAGNIYGAYGDDSIRKITPDGVVSVVPTSWSVAVQPNRPYDVVVSANGAMYFKQIPSQIAKALPGAGGVLGIGPLTAYADGYGDLAVNAAGNLYSSSGNSIYRFADGAGGTGTPVLFASASANVRQIFIASVPEPGSAFLLFCGAGVLGFCRRRG